jgi:FkbM family methyltransferase
MFDQLTFTPDLFIDAGPGVPNSEAWAFRERYPDVPIHGFEPSRIRYRQLLDADYPGWLHNVALAECVGLRTLYCVHAEMKNASFFTHGDHTDSETVVQVSLNEFFRDLVGRNIVIWGDIEGAELQMLKGASLFLELRRIAALVLEVRPVPGGEGWCLENQVIQYLADFGYAITAKGPVRDPQGGHYDALFTRDTCNSLKTSAAT